MQTSPKPSIHWLVFAHQLDSHERYCQSLVTQYSLNMSPEELISILKTKFFLYYRNYPHNRPYIKFVLKKTQIVELHYGKKDGKISVYEHKLVEPWLKRCLKNEAMNHCTKTHRTKIVSYDAVAYKLDDPKVYDEDFIENENLRQMVKQLKPLHTRLIELTEFNDLSYREAIPILIEEGLLKPHQDPRKLSDNLRQKKKTAMKKLRKMVLKQLSGHSKINKTN